MSRGSDGSGSARQRTPRARFDRGRGFLIANWLLSLLLASCAGELALTPVDERKLGMCLGLLLGLLANGVWELFLRARTVLRGPGPLVWGTGLLFIGAGVRGAIITPSQPHTTAAACASVVMIAIGVLIERGVLRRVLGLTAGRAST